MSKFRNIRVYVPTPEISEEVQKVLFEDGCFWIFNEKTVANTFSKWLFVLDDGEIKYGTERDAGKETIMTYQSILDPFYEVKVAWANGEGVQFRYHIINQEGKLVLTDWEDWNPKDIIDISRGHDWRIKPKTKIIKQWERKAFNPYTDMVVVVTSKDRNHRSLNSDLPMWIGEAYEVEYEVPND